jgi:hypothetical protein
VLGEVANKASATELDLTRRRRGGNHELLPSARVWTPSGHSAS